MKKYFLKFTNVPFLFYSFFAAAAQDAPPKEENKREAI